MLPDLNPEQITNLDGARQAITLLLSNSNSEIQKKLASYPRLTESVKNNL